MSPHTRSHTTDCPPRGSEAGWAFSRVDVLAVAAVLMVLGVLGLPALGGLRRDGDRQSCSANFRQLARAWVLYAEDNGGRLPGNLDGGDAMSAANTNRGWVVGWMDNSTFTPANTNTQLLLDSQLGRYVDSASVYRCPADPSLSHGRTGDPRVRSVSMNSYLGPRAAPYTAGFRQFSTLNSIVTPRPAECLVFLEEREDSLNDGCFFIDMTSYEPSRPTARVMVDYPADRHEGGATMGFVDGHVETWRWVDARTRPALRPGLLLPLNVPHPNSRDVLRIQEAASRRID